MIQSPPSRIHDVLARARAGRELRRGDLLRLLAVGSRQEAEPVFATARELRQRHFGRRVFLYGFV